MTLTFPPGVELMTDVSAAAWAEERLMARPFATMAATVPDVFESYARILHPAYRRLEDGREEAVTWATVASWTGRVAHPLMQFARLAGLGTDPNEQPDWGRRPEEGEVPTGLQEPLARVPRGAHHHAGGVLDLPVGGLRGARSHPGLRRPRAREEPGTAVRPVQRSDRRDDLDLGWPDYP